MKTTLAVGVSLGFTPNSDSPPNSDSDIPKTSNTASDLKVMFCLRVNQSPCTGITNLTIDFISDHYLFIESSHPRRDGDTATLISPEIELDNAGCLSLKAHMYGRDIGALKIEVIQGSSRRELLTKVGDQGNKWLSLDVGLPACAPFKVTN